MIPHPADLRVHPSRRAPLASFPSPPPADLRVHSNGRVMDLAAFRQHYLHLAGELASAHFQVGVGGRLSGGVGGKVRAIEAWAGGSRVRVG